MNADIEAIRKARDLSREISLKPSPYLKDSYVDEYGDDRKVVLRNYEKIGIAEMLRRSRLVLGDDTGLGKTVQLLSVFGYIWMVEPEYVPVVVCRKSALYQWGAETSRFMQGMEAVLADGEPYERAAAYRDFFEGHDPAKKRLLVLTYDSVLKDGKKSVVRDRSHKASKAEKASLREARASLKESALALEAEKKLFSEHFTARGPGLAEHVKDVLKAADPDAPAPVPPPGWGPEDEERLTAAVSARNRFKAAEVALGRAKDAAEPPLVVPGISDLVDSMLERHPGAKLMFVFDEVHALKNPQGKIHQECAGLANRSARVVGMTATPVQNRLMEFFAIFKIVHPALFPKVTHFHRDHCIVKLQPIGGGRKVPVVVGHTASHLDSFNAKAEPFYISRRKHDVAKELPSLVSREIECVLSPEQDELYDIAEVGLLDQGTVSDVHEEDSSAMLKAMTMVQQACNAPQLLMDEEGTPFEGESSKVEALVEILQDSPGMKTIVFSRFEKMVTLIEERLKKEKIGYVRVTGKESDPKKRRAAVLQFQDPASGKNVVLITTAGAESINLQAAGHVVFVDSPFSWGQYVQLTGRAIRIGSTHVTVIATHLVARRRGGGKTIDDHVIKILREKKKLADKVAGDGLLGGLEFSETDDVRELFKLVAASRSGADPAAVRAKAAEASSKKIRSTSKRKPKDAASPPPADASARAAFIELDMSDL